MTAPVIEEDETLIASNKVEGAAVYGSDGEKLGSIHNFLVDKESGQIAYAVIKSGGFLGLGSDYYSVPWTALEYDGQREAYTARVGTNVPMNAPEGEETPCFTPSACAEIDGLCVIEYEEIQDFRLIAKR